MEYYDQHVHTYFSFDSQETFEHYLALTDHFLVTTEHLDFRNPAEAFRDTVPDYPRYARQVAALNRKYQDRVLKGIEIGYTPDSKDAILDYLQGKDFDLMLLSIHQNGRLDFMDEGILDYSLAEVMTEYYRLMLEAVEQFSPANVLAHFDYGLRRFDTDVEALKQVEPLLKKIFRTAIEQEMAFELNTKSMYRYQNEELYRYGIALYKEAGGRLFTIGSDAHTAEMYRFRFQEAEQLLRANGIQEVTVYQKQQPIRLPIGKS